MHQQRRNKKDGLNQMGNGEASMKKGRKTPERMDSGGGSLLNNDAFSRR